VQPLPVGKGKPEDAEMRRARRVIQACPSVLFILSMPDAAAATVPSGESAEAALAFLNEMSPDLRGAAVLGPDGAALAATSGEPARWAEDAATLFAAADAAEGTAVEQVHIATEQGEVFAIRGEGLAAVAVTERFALASLLLFDLRSVLRELARGAH
jgi:predicted regulator of Ras-like GTPase activity (Roadblock/LC7/MglB family)